MKRPALPNIKTPNRLIKALKVLGLGLRLELMQTEETAWHSEMNAGKRRFATVA